jgi:uncharacterized membrane protein
LAERSSRRIWTVDAIRGLAILGVVIFHLVWDLEFVGFIEGIARHPAWLAFGRTLAGTFMALVGVSLVLAHPHEVRWRPALRRLCLIALAAAAITAMTRLTFPDAFVYFGILHAIAAATLVGILFLEARAIVGFLAGVAIVALPFAYDSHVFDTRWLAWIGFAAKPPPSNDFVPIFPWVGLTLLAVAATRCTMALGVIQWIADHEGRGHIMKTLGWMGRHSLAIYLIHQPILLAIILPLARLLG